MENSVNQSQSDDIVTQVPMKDRRPLPADVVNFSQFKCSYFSDRIPVYFRKEKTIEDLQNLTLGNYAGSTSKFVNCIPFREEYLGIYTTSFSNDGSVVAIGLGNGDVQIFNKKTNKLVKVLSSPLVGYPTTCVKFHPLSTDLLCCGSASGVTTLSSTEGEIKLTIEEGNNEVNILDIDWTGNTLMTGGKDAIIRIYDIHSEQEVKSYGSLDPSTSGLMESHNMRIYSLKFRPEEDSVFASGGWDGTVKVWDTRTAVGLVKTIQGPFIYGDAIDIKLALDQEGNLHSFLKSCVEQGIFIFQGSSANKLVPQVINTSLSSRNAKGFVLLKEFIPYCSAETYSDHAISWMLYCLTAANQSEYQYTKLSLEVFAILLEKSDKFQEVSKETGKQIVPKFLHEFLKLKNNVQIIAKVLTCIEICMRLYSGSFENNKHNLLKYMVCALEYGPRFIHLAAKCVGLLPALGGGGKQGVTHRTAWILQHDNLVCTLHDILDKLFDNVTEIQGTRKPAVQQHILKISFPSLSGRNPLSSAQQLASRFSAISECLRAMHMKSFCVAKHIGPSTILQIVCRGLAVTGASLSKKVSMEGLALTSVLPTIHTALLHILESFIVCGNRQLINEGHLISKLLNQVIKWTSSNSWPYAMNKPYRSVRRAAYECLSTWLSFAKEASCINSFVDELIPSILSDIYCKKPTVTLSMCSKTMKVGKKQLRKQLTALSKTNEDHTEKLGDVLANKNLCIKALDTLELVVNCATLLLKPELLKMIEITVLQILIEMGGSSLDVPVPYSDPDCRDHLYKLLLSLCLGHGLSSSMIALFTVGLNDLSPQVRSRCQSALSSLEKIYHPSAPSLSFPKERENTVVSMTEADILNAPLSSLCNNGLLVIRLIGNNPKPTKSVDEQKKCDSDVVEVIEIISSSDKSEGSESCSENLYLFSKEDGEIFNDEHSDLSIYSENSRTDLGILDVTVDSENVLEFGEIRKQDVGQEPELENNCHQLNTILETENDANVNNLNSDLCVLKRVNGVNESYSIEGLKDDESEGDEQPAVKKQKFEEIVQEDSLNNENGISTEDDEALMLKDFVDAEV